MKVSTLAQQKAAGRGSREQGSGVDYVVISPTADRTGTIDVSPESSVKVRKGNSRSPGLIRNIDVSALAAILFVLLFMFMMLTAIPHHGVSADLPKVRHPVSIPGARREDALIVSILRDRTMYFGKDKTRPSDLPAQIREGVASGAEKKIYIRADARVRYLTVLEVVDAVRSAGVERVAFSG